MSIPQKFINGSGGEILSVLGGPYYTTPMSADWRIGIVYFEFFSDANGLIQASPSAGEIVVEGSPMGVVYMLPSNTSKTLAVDVGLTPAYEPPQFDGCIIKARLSFIGITGALTCRAMIWRS